MSDLGSVTCYKVFRCYKGKMKSAVARYHASIDYRKGITSKPIDNSGIFVFNNEANAIAFAEKEERWLSSGSHFEIWEVSCDDEVGLPRGNVLVRDTQSKKVIRQIEECWFYLLKIGCVYVWPLGTRAFRMVEPIRKVSQVGK